MKQVSIAPRHLTGLAVWLVITAVFLFTSACQANQAAQPEVVVEPAAVVAEVAVQATAVPTEQSPINTDEPESVDLPPAEPISECLVCHTDKEMLIDTADPEEEVISENEGAG